jgi:hypothetical protein
MLLTSPFLTDRDQQQLLSLEKGKKSQESKNLGSELGVSRHHVLYNFFWSMRLLPVIQMALFV